MIETMTEVYVRYFLQFSAFPLVWTTVYPTFKSKKSALRALKKAKGASPIPHRISVQTRTINVESTTTYEVLDD